MAARAGEPDVSLLGYTPTRWSRPVGTPSRIRPSRPKVPTPADQAGLRLKDVPRASLAKIARQRWLDAQVRRALGPVLRRRPKRPR